jgi:hypothetical protein
MAPPYTYSFDRSHAPQTTLIVGGWNLPSYGSRPSYVFSGANTQMGDYSTYYTPSVYHSSSMPVPTNNFPWRVHIYPLVFRTKGINFMV